MKVSGKSFKELQREAEEHPLHSPERNQVLAEMARTAVLVPDLLWVRRNSPCDSEAEEITGRTLAGYVTAGTLDSVSLREMDRQGRQEEDVFLQDLAARGAGEIGRKVRELYM